MTRLVTPRCIGCGATPEELLEYVDAARHYGRKITPSDYVRREEGTFNAENGHFACTPCYIKMGEPHSHMGWIAP